MGFWSLKHFHGNGTNQGTLTYNLNKTTSKPIELKGQLAFCLDSENKDQGHIKFNFEISKLKKNSLEESKRILIQHLEEIVSDLKKEEKSSDTIPLSL